MARTACPANCSGHGTCVGNTCSCNTYYTGSDCSICTLSPPASHRSCSSLVIVTLLTLTRCRSFVRCDTHTHAARTIARTMTLLRRARNRSRAGHHQQHPHTPMAILQAHAGLACDRAQLHGSRAHVRRTFRADLQLHPRLFAAISSSRPVVFLSNPVYLSIYHEYSVATSWTLIQSIARPLDSQGDSDLYIKYGSYPRRDSYDAVDMGRNADYTVRLQNAAAGTWYAGIYGFFSCEYDITVHLQTTGTQACAPATSVNQSAPALVYSRSSPATTNHHLAVGVASTSLVPQLLLGPRYLQQQRNLHLQPVLDRRQLRHRDPQPPAPPVVLGQRGSEQVGLLLH